MMATAKRTAPNKAATKTKTRSQTTAKSIELLRGFPAGEQAKQRVRKLVSDQSSKAIGKWPTAEQLLEQAQACRHLAETLRQNMLTTAPNCPLRLPTVRGNISAIIEAFERVRRAYAIYRDKPIIGYPLLIRAIGSGHRGWEHVVDMPARNLIHTINSLFIYCGREPLTREPSTFGLSESPLNRKHAARLKRKSDDLPIELLNAVTHLTDQLEAEISSAAPVTQLKPAPTAKSGGKAGGDIGKYSPWIDQSEFSTVLVMNNIKPLSPTKGHAPRTIGRKKELWGAEYQPGSNSQTFRFEFSKLDELQVEYPTDWINRATS